MKKFFAPRFLSVLALSATVFLASCEEDPIQPVTPQIPTTYNFENVSYAGQSERLKMLDMIIEYTEAARAGTELDATKLKNMFGNIPGGFDTTFTRQLKDKTFGTEVEKIEALFDRIALASKSKTVGSNGVAGVVTSPDGTRKYLMDENGMDLAELIEKSIMGATFYYQAMGVYLEEGKTGDNVDNTTVKAGEGTPMQHGWDEAFGYFGVPKDFPTNVTGVMFWGNYTNRRNAVLANSKTIMDAFLKGRHAINNKDMATKKAAIATIRSEWEKVAVASAISYINLAQKNLTNDATRNHVLSEAIGFISALKYNPAKKITEAQMLEVLGNIGTNLYNVTPAKLDLARNRLSEIYGLNAVKDAL
ncbi:MAG: DUF4856 domain-containing protein [Bacteroidota bacterium]